jgi:hypothetical protein
MCIRGIKSDLYAISLKILNWIELNWIDKVCQWLAVGQ